MDVSGTAGHPLSGDGRKGDSFAESMRREGGTGTPPSFSPVSARSFRAGDLATNFSFVSPTFVPDMGEGMIDAIALGKGATEEMRRYEELTKYL